MKRAPLVLTGTACGLVAVIGYHTAVPQASALTSAAGGGTLSVGSGSASTPTATTSTSGAATTTASAASTTTAATATTTRSAVGSDVSYPFGDVQLDVTMTGSRITDVSVARHDVTDPRSQQIDQYVLPILRRQALQAQSARIDGISGASYTCVAYEQSLQSALDRLRA